MLFLSVSNLQEIGVSAHFTVYVTDNETAEVSDADSGKPTDATGSSKYSNRLQDELNRLET